MKRRRLPTSLEPLAVMPPSETTPVWLEVARRQAGRRQPKDLLAQYESDGFVQPSALDLRISVRLDAMVLEAARGFEAVLLSPLAPLGACSAIAPTSQDRTISAVRSLEVVSDPTNALAGVRETLAKAAHRRRTTLHGASGRARSARARSPRPLPAFPDVRDGGGGTGKSGGWF